MTKRLVAALVVALGMLTFAAVASAEPKVDSSQRLRVQVDPNQLAGIGMVRCRVPAQDVLGLRCGGIRQRRAGFSSAGL